MSKERPLMRVLLAQVVGGLVVLLLQAPSIVARSESLLRGGEGFWTQLGKLWEYEAREGMALIGLVPFLTWYLIPALVCVSVVGWRFVPKLRR